VTPDDDRRVEGTEIRPAASAADAVAPDATIGHCRIDGVLGARATSQTVAAVAIGTIAYMSPVPLRDVARFRSLAERLEAQMAATRLD
jgi:hypothetical protein